MGVISSVLVYGVLWVPGVAVAVADPEFKTMIFHGSLRV
jgi:hypothetical protein